MASNNRHCVWTLRLLHDSVQQVVITPNCGCVALSRSVCRLQQSPLKSPARAPVAAAAGDINWRAAASAAASAVVAGLSSSPQPGWRSPSAAVADNTAAAAAAAATATATAAGSGAKQQLYAPQLGQVGSRDAGAGSTGAVVAGPAKSGLVGQGKPQGGDHIPAHRQGVTETAAGPAPCAVSRAGQGLQGADVASGSNSLPTAAPNSTSRLINQLASRAAEAQRLLESLQQ